MSKDIDPGSLKEDTTLGATSSIAEGMFFKGNLIGDKNLSVEGRIEGRIDLRSADVIIRENGVVNANVVAEKVIIKGRVTGDVTAMKQVQLAEGAVVTGNITSPSVAIAEGANFKGAIDMDGKALSAVTATLKAVEKVVSEEDTPADDRQLASND